MLPQKSFKIRIFNLAENEFQGTKFHDFQRSLSNSLTFPGFPGQWQPWQIVVFGAGHVCYKRKLVISGSYSNYWWMQIFILVHWGICLFCIESCLLLSLPGDFGGNAHRGARWHSMESFGSSFHSKITWDGTGLIEGCNKRKCVFCYLFIEMKSTLTRFPTNVNASSLSEIVKIRNKRISN